MLRQEMAKWYHNNPMNKMIRNFIKKHAEESEPRECGGIVVKDSEEFVAKRCKNISSTPNNHCVLSKKEILSKSKGYKLTYFYHSHPDGETNDFSWEDKYISEKLKLKLILYCLKDKSFKVYEPKGWSAPLVGRNYCVGIFGDSELVEDYYKKYFNFSIKEFENANVFDASGTTLTKREIKELSDFPAGLRFKDLDLEAFCTRSKPIGYFYPYQKKGTFECLKLLDGMNKKTMQGYIVKLLTKSKFKLVKNLKKHDLLILGGKAKDRFEINYPSHLGIYLGDNSILCHPYREKSRIQKMDSFGYGTDIPLKSLICHILRPLFDE